MCKVLLELDELLNFNTPVVKIKDDHNDIYIKKEDAIPFSFGGNKCRIAASYFKEIIKGHHDVVITYGSSSSNLCRVIANLSSKYGLRTVIVSPEENYITTPNSEMVKLLGAEIVKCKINDVSTTIDNIIDKYKQTSSPYFIYGGGHGVHGTDSYRTVMKQIVDFENDNQIKFDYIFITLATGTSMSGLIVENSIGKYQNKIIGISIARILDKAKVVMKDALDNYEKVFNLTIDDRNYEILGDYRCDGYGTYNSEILDLIKQQFVKNGLNLDTTYTGKAFFGMLDFLNKNGIENKNILFVHTGGTPLFFKDNCNYFIYK